MLDELLLNKELGLGIYCRSMKRWVIIITFGVSE